MSNTCHILVIIIYLILILLLTGLWDLPPCSGKVKSFDKFDHRFFGYDDEKQVEFVDPQDRKLLEATYEAIIDAGE